MDSSRHSLVRQRSESSGTVSHSQSRYTIQPLLWRDTLRLLNVIDVESGESIFRKKWKWPQDGHIESVPALVNSFLQFAREIDDGGMRSVFYVHENI